MYGRLKLLLKKINVYKTFLPSFKTCTAMGLNHFKKIMAGINHPYLSIPVFTKLFNYVVCNFKMIYDVQSLCLISITN